VSLMFFKQKTAAPFPLHEFILKLDELIAAGRAGRIDGRDIANTLDARANALRLAFVSHAPSDAAF
jgi:hypothetical protein